MFVSVLIPHLNNSYNLQSCINALIQQSYPDNLYEIIVIDNGSNEQHLQNIEKFKNIKNLNILYENKTGSYSARNKGIDHANGDIIAFTDSDCTPKYDWLEKGVVNLNNQKNCGAIGGQIKLTFADSSKLNMVELYEKMSCLRQDIFIQNRNFAATANLFTSKKIILEVGKFNDSFVAAGDQEWCHRVYSKGYKIIYCHDTIVYHPTRKSFKDFVKRQIRIAGGNYTLEQNCGTKKIHIFFKNILELIPPIITLYRIAFSERIKEITSTNGKIKLLAMFIFVKYLRIFEKFRLMLGFKAKNW